METIRIETPYKKDDFIRLNLVLWKIQWRKLQKQLRGYAIGSVVILSLGLLVTTEKEPNNPFVVIGIAFSIISILMFLLIAFSKRKYTQKIKSIAEKYNEVKMDCIYEISDESLKYWDKEKYLDFKWPVFSHYSTYKEYLVIGVNNSIVPPFILEKKDADDDKYDRIVELVKSKLVYQEIK